MPKNPERPLAAHVQAAIAAGRGVGQAKMASQGVGKGMAAHVQAAIAEQAKMRGQGVGQVTKQRPQLAPVQMMEEEKGYSLRSKKKKDDDDDSGSILVEGTFTSGKPSDYGWNGWENPSLYKDSGIPNNYKNIVWRKKFDEHLKLYFVWFTGFSTVYITYKNSSGDDIAFCDDKFGKKSGYTWHHTGIGKGGAPDYLGNYMQQVFSFLHESTCPHVGGEFMGHSK